MKSININDLLYRELSNESIPVAKVQVPNQDEMTVFFKTLLGQDFKSVAASNFKENKTKEGYQFWLWCDHDSLVIREIKSGKKREFYLQREKQFLSVNKRKAVEKDFSTFNQKLKQIGLFIISKKQPLMVHFKGNSAGNESVSDVYSKPLEMFLGDKAKGLLWLKENDEIILFASCLSKAANYFSRHINKGTQAVKVVSNHISEMLKAFKVQFLEILKGYKRLYISNSEQTKLRASMVYGLLIEKEKAIYVEKSSRLKQKFSFDFIKNTVVYTGGIVTEGLLKWLVQRVQTIGSDITRRRASVFYD